MRGEAKEEGNNKAIGTSDNSTKNTRKQLYKTNVESSISNMKTRSKT